MQSAMSALPLIATVKADIALMTEHTRQAVNDYLKLSRKKPGELCEPSSFCTGLPR